MEQGPLARKEGEVDLLFKLTTDEVNRTRTKKELIKRITRIERLAREKNYGEIEKLLRENYV
jgi:CRISPR/Cas system-associated protein Cas5 (RAMP superfamily)